MSETADRRDPDFDLRTAKPDPRWLVSDLILARADPDTYMRILCNETNRLYYHLKAQYPDETMEVFSLLVWQPGGYRVVVGFGFSHNPLDNTDET
jgi:hypothetical protein